MSIIKQLAYDLYLMFLIGFTMAVFGTLLLIGFHIVGLANDVVEQWIYESQDSTVEMYNE